MALARIAWSRFHPPSRQTRLAAVALSLALLSLPPAAMAQTNPRNAGSVASAAPPRPPRLDGTYVGGTMSVVGSMARVNDLPTDGAFIGRMTELQVGQTVLPWLALGFCLGAATARHQDQTLNVASLGVDVTAMPIPRRNLSLRVGFGFGAGAIVDEDEEGRFGFGGASFHAALRYTFFPWAKKRRPTRGGGFGLAPELGWYGQTPAAVERPMANTLFLGLSAVYYFGH